MTPLSDPTMPQGRRPVPQKHPAPQAMQRYPVLIGISGKRVFDEDAGRDRKIADALAQRFEALFNALDADLPETPKVLLCGGAMGADLIAAEAALGTGPSWSVAVILPFDCKLFAEDFDGSLDTKRGETWRERYADHARTFKRVLDRADESPHRVLVRELPYLSMEDEGFAAEDRLSRRASDYDRDFRRNHYEQVGQYIAETATIMIVVMDDDEQAEPSEATGGTARVVAVRRAGAPDACGAAVARRSTILRSHWPETKPLSAGYVWLIDPVKEDRCGRYPVRILEPLLDRSVEDIYGGRPGRDRTREDESVETPDTLHMRASLSAARGFDRFNLEKARKTGRQNPVVADLSLIDHVPNALNLERAQIAERQRAINKHARNAFRMLAWLFVLAVLTYELFAKFFHDNWIPLTVYMGWFVLIVLVVFWEHMKLWEAVAEDYRAVVEMLRVQRAWFSAGLTERVDREHLQGVDPDLARIRDNARTLIAWIMLRGGLKGDPPARDWANVRGTATQPRDMRAVSKSPSDWVGSQLLVFHQERPRPGGESRR
jgi:hypothetical protein